VLAARLACNLFDKTNGNLREVLRWIDKMLIRLVKKFGEYRHGDVGSLRLHEDFTLFPVFMFHLRRCDLLQIFNSSPDETTFFRHTFNRSPVSDGIVMIQPALIVWDFSGKGPRPALLDSTSVQHDNILLLDTFFHVIIHYGATVAQWRKSGYQDDPQYAYFGQLLAEPIAEGQRLVANRFPVPKLVECDQHGSQARFLYNKINPSMTHHQQSQGGGQYGTQQGEIVYTDDASLQTFMQHLKKVVVAKEDI